jgi:hypothetical protein
MNVTEKNVNATNSLRRFLNEANVASPIENDRRLKRNKNGLGLVDLWKLEKNRRSAFSYRKSL